MSCDGLPYFLLLDIQFVQCLLLLFSSHGFTLPAVFKTEKNAAGSSSTGSDGETIAAEPELGLLDTYKLVWKIVRHPLMPIVILILMTYGFAFSSTEAMTNLKLIDRGVPKEKIAMLSIPMIPVKIGITLFLTR